MGRGIETRTSLMEVGSHIIRATSSWHQLTNYDQTERSIVFILLDSIYDHKLQSLLFRLNYLYIYTHFFHKYLATEEFASNDIIKELIFYGSNSMYVCLGKVQRIQNSFLSSANSCCVLMLILVSPDQSALSISCSCDTDHHYSLVRKILGTLESRLSTSEKK